MVCCEPKVLSLNRPMALEKQVTCFQNTMVGQAQNRQSLPAMEKIIEIKGPLAQNKSATKQGKFHQTSNPKNNYLCLDALSPGLASADPVFQSSATAASIWPLGAVIPPLEPRRQQAHPSAPVVAAAAPQLLNCPQQPCCSLSYLHSHSSLLLKDNMLVAKELYWPVFCQQDPGFSKDFTHFIWFLSLSVQAASVPTQMTDWIHELHPQFLHSEIVQPYYWSCLQSTLSGYAKNFLSHPLLVPFFAQQFLLFISFLYILLQAEQGNQLHLPYIAWNSSQLNIQVHHFQVLLSSQEQTSLQLVLCHFLTRTISCPVSNNMFLNSS